MLENIKMLLGLTLDDSKDDLINYHIGVVQQKILNYINQTIFPVGANYIVTEIVVNRMNGKMSNVKTIQRGDVTIQYETTGELKPYYKELSAFKTLKVI